VGQFGAPAHRNRAGRRTRQARVAPDARDLLLAFSYIAIDDEIVEAAMNEPDRALRSLDAIHLATARLLGPDLDAIVSYDDRLTAAATGAGLVTASPHG
jgi:predicted nucleic acid-binding protein